MSTLVVKNATVTTPLGRNALKGVAMARLHTIENAAVVAEDGIISYVGPQSEMPKVSGDVTEIDAAGRALLPGFVDSHTHLIFGGFRPDEFEWRLKGDSYMSIMERGGGIQSTVNATRGESVDALAAKASWFIDRMAEMGVTTVEAKSGYGLSLESEVKMLEVIRRLADSPETKARVVATFMGAHAIPTEFKGRTAEYVDHIIAEMLPKVKDMAVFCDIFTEKNVFELDDSRRLLEAARENGFKLKMHADEIVTLGGAELAVELGAVSADHLLHVSDAGVRALAEGTTVATLLPLTAFALREPYAPARRLIDGGAAVALATDLNPGSCFSGSIPLTIALACIYMNMSIEETITAVTLNGAAALDMANTIGSVEVGKSADMIILDYDNYRMLPYYVGMNCVNTVIRKGEIVVKNSNYPNVN